MEHGATRNFQAEKLLEEEEKRVQKEREDEELNNPMKVSQAPPVPVHACVRVCVWVCVCACLCVGADGVDSPSWLTPQAGCWGGENGQ